MIVTDKVVTQFCRDLSVGKGKMADLKRLMEDIAESIQGHKAPFSLDELANVYNEIPDLNKVSIDVDNENLSAEEVYISEISGNEGNMLGFYEIEGFPVFGLNLGGDWETPIYAVIVTDGTKLYRYIPLKGNCYNPDYNSAYGNNDDDEEGEDVQVDFDMIKEDICMAFNIAAEIPTEVEDSISEISDSIEELADAVEALTDDETGAFLRNGLDDIFEKVKEAIKNASTTSSKTSSELAKAKTTISTLETTVKDLNSKVTSLDSDLKTAEGELAKYKSGAISSASPEAAAFRDIAKIVTAVCGGATPTTGSALPPVSAPVAPAKPLKKITLPSKTISFEYVYGVEMDGNTAILHIIKKDDWATSELAKEGRVDVDTISRLKAEVPLKRDKFIYILDDTYDSVEDVVDAVSKVSGINLEHSADVQAKF